MSGTSEPRPPLICEGRYEAFLNGAIVRAAGNTEADRVEVQYGYDTAQPTRLVTIMRVRRGPASEAAAKRVEEMTRLQPTDGVIKILGTDDTWEDMWIVQEFAYTTLASMQFRTLNQFRSMAFQLVYIFKKMRNYCKCEWGYLGPHNVAIVREPQVSRLLSDYGSSWKVYGPRCVIDFMVNNFEFDVDLPRDALVIHGLLDSMKLPKDTLRSVRTCWYDLLNKVREGKPLRTVLRHRFFLPLEVRPRTKPAKHYSTSHLNL